MNNQVNKVCISVLYIPIATIERLLAENKPMINAAYHGSAWATTRAQLLPQLSWLLWCGSFYNQMMMISVISQKNQSN